jgi:very-short-patch-repair endonuclease
VGELAASRHGAISRRQAADNGIGRNAIARLIERGVLREPVPGVLLVVGAPTTWQRRVYTAVLERGDDRFAIGSTAARLHALDGFTGDDRVVVVGRRGERTAFADVALSQTREHYDTATEVTEVDGIRCTTIARTLCDIARLHPERYERAVDDFVRRGFSLTWLEMTAAGVPTRGPWRERVTADLARRQSGGRVRDSWFERLVEACVRSPRLPPVERQFEVCRPNGELIGRVDLAIPSLRLAIEAHSRQFHTGPTREAFDQRRDNELAIEGWHTAYVGWSDATRTPATVRRTVERIAARRAKDLGIDLRTLVNPQRPALGR